MTKATVWDYPPHELARTLFQESGDALLLVDPNTLEVVDVNPMALKLTHLERESIVGTSVTEFVIGEKTPLDYTSAVRNTTTFHSQPGFRLRSSNSEQWIPVSLTRSRLHFSDLPPLALLALRDLRDLQEMMGQLQSAANELKRVLVSVQDCVWSAVTDRQGQWQYAYLSPVIERLSGRGVSEFLEDPSILFGMVHSEDRQAYRQFMADWKDHPSAHLDYRLCRPDGTVRWIREQVNSSRLEDGLSLFGILSDITESKQGEEERRQLEAQMQQFQHMKSLGVMAGGIAHDFNNLLTGILGNADLALTELSTNSAPHQHITSVVNAAERAAELTNQMRAYSGNGSFFLEPLNLSSLIRNMTSMIRVYIPKDCEVKFELDPVVPAIEADATQMKQILLNLIHNAAEALGKERGCITISTTAHHCAQTDLSEPYLEEPLPEGTYVHLSVSDTGSGMSEEIQAKIFDPFFTTKFTGRGLGLSTVFGIVRGHRGIIRCWSRPGEGTAFELLLPAAELQTAPTEMSEPQEQTATRHGVVLVAEDEESVCQMTCRMLEQMGFSVMTAESGRKALDLLEANADKICLVLLDTDMPELDGFATYQEIRRRQWNVPVILLSGSNRQKTPRVLDGDSPPFLQKPYRFDELKKAVSNVLPVRQED